MRIADCHLNPAGVCSAAAGRNCFRKAQYADGPLSRRSSKRLVLNYV